MSCGSNKFQFTRSARCSRSRARVGRFALPHATVETPVFMPVGTKGTLKGILPDQLEAMDCRIILGNTYHLGTKPGPELLEKAGGLHKFIGWNRALLTDSGGFQMVSLLKLAEITERGVNFKSPYDGSDCLLTPEHSIKIQNAIGADIMMQLDDVISTTTTGPRVEEAMHRTVRWLDRCIESHSRPDDQIIFPIVQGGLDPELREKCITEMLKRDFRGIAIGGLSGGETKDEFWRMVSLCTSLLPEDKPKYCMGVGFAEDLVVCVALGVDMFDCVFPTRTARFGCGLVETGQINLKQRKYALDFRPIQDGCECSTCKTYTRAYIHAVVNRETVSCHMLSIHNTYYQLKLMKSIRESIEADEFPEFVQNFMLKRFGSDVPVWIKEALNSVNINV